MSKLTGKEIIEKIKASGDTVEDFAYGGAEVEVAGPNKQVFSKGGEDEGSDWRAVYHFTDHDVYIEVRGYYQSHYGTDFEDWESAVREVTPKEKTITVYE